MTSTEELAMVATWKSALRRAGFRPGPGPGFDAATLQASLAVVEDREDLLERAHRVEGHLRRWDEGPEERQ